MFFDTTERSSILSDFGASSEEIEELLRYDENVFADSINISHFPLADELFVKDWEQYANEVEHAGTIQVLANYLVQLRFPIEKGISASADYIAATRRGQPTYQMPEATGLHLRAPEQCQVVIHPTPAGKIPLLIALDRQDFIDLVRAFSKHNEPADVPNSMGACVISGYNNWARLHAAVFGIEREGYEPSDAFRKIKPQKHLYQDCFIILSNSPYSGVSAAEMNMDEQSWNQASLLIRREHECTHYFTNRVFCSMRNNLLDEFIADYCGITVANGHFRSDWFLRFLGLESFPLFREGGRLQNYRGDPPLSDRAFAVLGCLIRKAARNVERFDRDLTWYLGTAHGNIPMIVTLAGMTLEQLASPKSYGLLHERLMKCLDKLPGQSVR
jgi:hypothetical protein